MGRERWEPGWSQSIPGLRRRGPELKKSWWEEGGRVGLEPHLGNTVRRENEGTREVNNYSTLTLDSSLDASISKSGQQDALC